jgi:YVTN family beta-propeller protein
VVAPVTHGTEVLKTAFYEPDAMAVAGAHLFVANLETDSITVLNTATGAVVTAIAGTKYMINRPSSMLSSGTDLFVTNNYGNSVTEVNTGTGALVRVISGTAFHFDGSSGRSLSPWLEVVSLWPTTAAGSTITGP